jgi:hypothetical protein
VIIIQRGQMMGKERDDKEKGNSFGPRKKIEPAKK